MQCLHCAFIGIVKFHRRKRWHIRMSDRDFETDLRSVLRPDRLDLATGVYQMFCCVDMPMLLYGGNRRHWTYAFSPIGAAYKSILRHFHYGSCADNSGNRKSITDALGEHRDIRSNTI